MSQLLIILVYYSFPSLYLKCYKFLVILFEQKPGLILRLLNYNTPFIIAVLEVYTCYQGEDNKKICRWTFIFRTCTVNYNKKMFVNSDVSYSWFYNCTEVKNLLILVKKKSYDLVKTRLQELPSEVEELKCTLLYVDFVGNYRTCNACVDN